MLCQNVNRAFWNILAGQRGMWAAVLAGFVVFIAQTNAAAMPDKKVGWVERIDGPSQNITIMHSDSRISAKLLAPLHVDDQVVVEDRNAKLVARVGGKRVTVTQDNSPYVIGNGPDAPSVTGNAAAWLASFLTSQHDEEVQYGSVPLMTRGRKPPPAVTVVSDDPSSPSLVVAGRRELFLPISGGRAPYRVHLVNQQGKVAAYREFIPEPEARLTRFFLRKGTYELRLWDSRQRLWTGYIRAVSPSAAPEKARGPKMKSARDPRTGLLHAAELSMMEQGAWQLESYQKAAALPEDFYPAKVFRSALINGQVPVAKKP